MGSGAQRARMQSIIPFPMGGLWLKSQLWHEDFKILGSLEPSGKVACIGGNLIFEWTAFKFDSPGLSDHACDDIL
jgi:hypothetical protein